MEDTRISDLAKAIMEATSVKEVIDSNGGHVTVGTKQFYKVWILNSEDYVYEDEPKGQNVN